VLTGEADEFSCLVNHSTLIWCAGDGDASSSAELEQALVPQLAKSPKNRIGVDLEDGREVACRRKALTRLRLPVSDGTADLTRHLFVKVERLRAVYPHEQCDAASRDACRISTSA